MMCSIPVLFVTGAVPDVNEGEGPAMLNLTMRRTFEVLERDISVVPVTVFVSVEDTQFRARGKLWCTIYVCMTSHTTPTI